MQQINSIIQVTAYVVLFLLLAIMVFTSHIIKHFTLINWLQVLMTIGLIWALFNLHVTY